MTTATETQTVNVAALFVQASRLKLRFDNPNGGQLAVEDLWDLPLTSANKASLDKIAVDLFRKLRESEEMSFVIEPTGSKDYSVTQLKFDIVRHVIETRKTENAVKLEAAAKADRKKLLLDALAAAEKGDLASKSPEELRAMIAAL